MRTTPARATSRLAVAGTLLVVPAVTLVPAGPSAAATTTFTVDGASPVCSDTGPGSAATPLCTIGAATKMAVAPGDEVLVRPGVYREQVTPTASGTASAPIVYAAANSGVVVLGTQDLSDPAGWTSTSTSAWSHSFDPVSAPTQVFWDGQRLLRAGSATSTNAGSYYYDGTAHQLYVDVGGADPADGHTVEAGAFTYGFKLRNLSNVVVEGFVLEGQNASGVDVEGSSAMTVTGVEARNAGSYGVALSAVTGPSSVTHSLADHNASIGIKLSGGTTGVSVDHDVSHDNGLHGISLQNAPANTVADDVTYANASPSGRVATGIDVEQASTDVTIEDNTSYGNQDSGIQVYNGATGALVRRNVSYDNGDHGLDCLNSPNETVVGNSSVGNLTAGINLEGTCTGGTVFDNISVDNGLNSPRSVGDIRVDATAIQGATVDYNLVYLTSAGVPYAWGGTSDSSLSAFQQASGQGAHDQFADPQFVDRAAGDLHLTSTSPAIDAASSAVSGFSPADHDGMQPFDDPGTPNTGAGTPSYADVGAYEYVGPAAVVRVTPGAGTSPLTVTANASGSADALAPITSYAFDCGNGTVVGPQQAATATCQYTSPGSFVVTVTVTDARGETDSAASEAVSVHPAHGHVGPGGGHHGRFGVRRLHASHRVLRRR